MNDNDSTLICDWLYQHLHVVTMAGQGDDSGEIVDGAIAVRGDEIVWVGPMSDLPEVDAAGVVEGLGRLVTPGIIDCHTHLVYGGSRAEEWRQRLNGASYEQIARAGGGILSTVRATREASEAELLESALRRARQLLRCGVTTLEIKSGYGLTTEDELKMLRVARRVGDELAVDVHPTLLAAHAVPPEFAGRADDYIDLVCTEMIPAARGLATAVDVFTENIAFDLSQTERVFQAALDHGFKIKIHADQLSNMGGAALAARMGAVSADHLEYLDEAGVRAMAEAGTVATLLPGAFYFLNESQRPPVASLHQHGVPIAVATDLNPGSSPLIHPLVGGNMACTLFGLTPEESLRGMTSAAAAALGVQDRAGRIAVGCRADFALWDVRTAAELVYMIGHNPCVGVCRGGRWQGHPGEL